MGELTDRERGTPAELEGRCEQCRGALTESEDSPSFFFFSFFLFIFCCCGFFALNLAPLHTLRTKCFPSDPMQVPAEQGAAPDESGLRTQAQIHMKP